MNLLSFVKKPLLGKRRANALIAFYNAFVGNFQIKRGANLQEGLFISDRNVILQLKDATNENTAVNAMTFRGLWLTGTSAVPQEVWKVETGTYAGVYVCVTATSLDPWEGFDWVMLTQTNAIGNWT